MRRGRVFGALIVVALLVAGVVFMKQTATYEVTAYFDRATGIYVGDNVTAIGVRIGKVASITPGPQNVKIVMELDNDVKLANNARAAIVSPALVAVRHIEIGPLWESGDVLGDDDTIPLARTAVPVEWDELKLQLVRFSKALGPQGANRDGALSRALDVSAANLKGQGKPLAETLDELSEAMELLSDNRTDLFTTVRNLETFTDVLVDSDAQVREFTRNLAKIAQILDDQRDEFQATLKSTATAFDDVTRVIKDNKAAIVKTTVGVSDVADVVGRNREQLADLAQLLPTTLSNLYNIYDPIIPAYTGVLAAAQFSSPATFLCSTLFSLGGTPAQCQKILEPLAKFLTVNPPPIGITPIERDGYPFDNAPYPAAAAGTPATSTGKQPVVPPDLTGEIQKLLGTLG